MTASARLNRKWFTPAADRVRLPAPPGPASGGGSRRPSRPARRRCSAAGVSAGQARSKASVSAKSPLQYSAMSQPAASAWTARSAGAPDSAFIARSSVTRTPSKPIRPRMTSLITAADSVAGRSGIERLIDDMGGHHPWQVGVQRERPDIGGQIVARQPSAAKDGCRPAPGHARAHACRPAGRPPPALRWRPPGPDGRRRPDARRRRGRR